MELIRKQISSLEKVRDNDVLMQDEMSSLTALQGERISYQICLKAVEPPMPSLLMTVQIESELADCVKLYQVRDACMDMPVRGEVPMEDYITQEPGLMPDILVPLEETDYKMTISPKPTCIWVRVDVPLTAKAGIYSVKLQFDLKKRGGEYIDTFETNMDIEVVAVPMPEQKLIYTRWMHLDCIAEAHSVEIFSEQHWELIDKYIKAAADVGVNMMMVPVHTPPLDTDVGTRRKCIQLVGIEKRENRYLFDFERFRRYIGICKKNGIRYYEIAHMFSQWGAQCAPNIMVTENGKTYYMFGWHVAAESEEYRLFLKQYIRAISEEIEKEGITEYTYYHISDEPSAVNMESYQKAEEIIRDLTGKSTLFDALSDYTFYEKGIVKCPVTSVRNVHEFIQHGVDPLWTYYCGNPQSVFPNCLMAMPSYRTRILGILLYKYDIKGFLHWGFNYYHACRSWYAINPYSTTSGDCTYPSGDAFIVYPGKNCVYPSIRGEITFEAIQDIAVCLALEKLIGRQNVINMIDERAGFELRFDHYPRNKEYLTQLRSEMIQKMKFYHSMPEHGEELD